MLLLNLVFLELPLFVSVVLTVTDQLNLILHLALDPNYLGALRALDRVFELEPVHQALLHACDLDQVLEAAHAVFVLEAAFNCEEVAAFPEAVQANSLGVEFVYSLELVSSH